jgi:hypothetical protein
MSFESPHICLAWVCTVLSLAAVYSVCPAGTVAVFRLLPSPGRLTDGVSIILSPVPLSLLAALARCVPGYIPSLQFCSKPTGLGQSLFCSSRPLRIRVGQLRQLLGTRSGLPH